MAANDNKISVAAAVCVAVLVYSSCLLSVHAKYDIKDGRHNITMGQRSRNPWNPNQLIDTLLFQDLPKLDGSRFPYPKVQSHDICYPPPKGSNTYKFTITAFNVTDLVPNGEGGYAFIESGGLNSNNLCLHLKTQRGKGYLFRIEIWGKNF